MRRLSCLILAVTKCRPLLRDLRLRLGRESKQKTGGRIIAVVANYSRIDGDYRV